MSSRYRAKLKLSMYRNTVPTMVEVTKDQPEILHNYYPTPRLLKIVTWYIWQQYLGKPALNAIPSLTSNEYPNRRDACRRILRSCSYSAAWASEGSKEFTGSFWHHRCRLNWNSWISWLSSRTRLLISKWHNGRDGGRWEKNNTIPIRMVRYRYCVRLSSLRCVGLETLN